MGGYNFQAWTHSDVQIIGSHFRKEGIRRPLFLCWAPTVRQAPCWLAAGATVTPLMCLWSGGWKKGKTTQVWVPAREKVHRAQSRARLSPL